MNPYVTDEKLLDFLFNDDIRPGTLVHWTCPFCGAETMIKKVTDAAKHMTKCPNNPYK